MVDVPPDFGGFLAFWDSDGKLILARYGHGWLQEAMEFTPLNLLQAHKTLGQVIDQAVKDGVITEEHLRQASLLPSSRDLENVIPRDQVDEIAGSD